MKARTFYILILLLMFFTMPSQGARQHLTNRRTAATTDAEHRADLKKLLNIQPPEEFLVMGQGAPRPELGQCERDLGGFQKALKAKGLKLLETATCVGTDAFYFPTFRATSSAKLTVVAIEGGRFNSQTFCELQGQRMALEQPKNNRLLEVGCKQLGLNDVFQPVVISLREPLPGEAE